MSCNCMKCELTREELLLKISEIQFVAIELNLYINTHPDDEAALQDYLAYAKQLEALTEVYEERYGPLYNFGHSVTETGSWPLSQWPWE